MFVTLLCVVSVAPELENIQIIHSLIIKRALPHKLNTTCVLFFFFLIYVSNFVNRNFFCLFYAELENIL